MTTTRWPARLSSQAGRQLSESTEGLPSRRLDLGGAVTVTAGMALVVFGIISTDSYAWSSARTVATLITGAAVLVSFVVIEGRFASNPIVPLRTFRRRTLTLANVQSTVVGAVVFGCYFFLSLYLQDVKHYSALRAGLAFLPMGLMTFGDALAASRLVRRLGIRLQLVIAPLVTAAAVFWLSRLTADSSYPGSLLVRLLLVGASIGVTFVPLTMAATMGVPPAESGLASGLLNTSRQLGGALGLAVLATIATAAALGRSRPHHETVASFFDALGPDRTATLTHVCRWHQLHRHRRQRQGTGRHPVHRPVPRRVLDRRRPGPGPPRSLVGRPRPALRQRPAPPQPPRHPVISRRRPLPQAHPLRPVEEPGQPHRQAASQARLDREDSPLPLSRLAAQRRNMRHIRPQRPARSRPHRPGHAQPRWPVPRPPRPLKPPTEPAGDPFLCAWPYYWVFAIMCPTPQAAAPPQPQKLTFKYQRNCRGCSSEA